jgi:hypothetical protein
MALLEPARAGEFAPDELSDIVATEFDPASAAAIARHPRGRKGAQRKTRTRPAAVNFAQLPGLLGKAEPD